MGFASGHSAASFPMVISLHWWLGFLLLSSALAFDCVHGGRWGRGCSGPGDSLRNGWSKGKAEFPSSAIRAAFVQPQGRAWRVGDPCLGMVQGMASRCYEALKRWGWGRESSNTRWSRGLVLWGKAQLQEYFAIANCAPLPQSLSCGAGVTLEGGR